MAAPRAPPVPKPHEFPKLLDILPLTERAAIPAYTNTYPFSSVMPQFISRLFSSAGLPLAPLRYFHEGSLVLAPLLSLLTSCTLAVAKPIPTKPAPNSRRPALMALRQFMVVYVRISSSSLNGRCVEDAHARRHSAKRSNEA